jgi:outer membrane protein insertion porin family
MLLRLSACLGCLLLLGSLQAQQALVIQDIRLEGHQRNQADYLFRFLESEAGQIFNASRAEQDAQQLQNLYSIAKADFRVDTLPENAIMLTFSIEEAWTFFPLFSINAVRNNLWLEIGANEINFLGRGMQLTGAYRNIDGRHNYQVFFRQPYIGGSQWGVFAGVHRYASTEPLYFSQGAVFYDYTNQSFDLGVSYELKPGHRLEAGAVYFIEDYAKTPDQELANPPGPDGLSIPKWLFKITHRYDRINYDGIYLDGLLNVTLLETVINTDDGSRFDMAINDLHLYRRLGTRGNLAMRLRLGLSTNLNSAFCPLRTGQPRQYPGRRQPDRSRYRHPGTQSGIPLHLLGGESICRAGGAVF